MDDLYALDDLQLENTFLSSFSHISSVVPNRNAAASHQSLHDITMENLSDQVRELSDVNARLMNRVCEKDHEISKLQAQLLVHTSTGLEYDSNTPKIVELAKAKREMTSKYEAEYSKVQKLLVEKKELEAKLTEIVSGKTPTVKIAPKVSPTNDVARKRCLTDSVTVKDAVLPTDTNASNLHHRLQAALEKASLASHENQCLKQQLQKSQRILERELGSGVDIVSLLRDENPTFKGRDEQIQMLKNKVDELKREVAVFRSMTARENISCTDNGFSECSITLTKRGAKSATNYYNARHREALNNADQKRREQFTALTQQHEILQRKHAELKSKTTAEKARAEYLGKENLRLTQFNRHVLQTCQKDAELIQYFQSTIGDLRETLSRTSLLSNLNDPKSKTSVLKHQAEAPPENCGSGKSIFDKIAHMETQIQELKRTHSVTIDQLQGSSSLANQKQILDFKLPAVNRTMVIAKSRSSPVKASTTSQQSDEEFGNESLNGSLPEQITRISNKSPKTSLNDPNTSMQPFEDTLLTCRNVTNCLQQILETHETITRSTREDLLIEKENSERVQIELNHLMLASEFKNRMPIPREYQQSVSESGQSIVDFAVCRKPNARSCKR